VNELAEEVDIDFYQDKDESAFLEAWKKSMVQSRMMKLMNYIRK